MTDEERKRRLIEGESPLMTQHVKAMAKFMPIPGKAMPKAASAKTSHHGRASAKIRKWAAGEW